MQLKRPFCETRRPWLDMRTRAATLLEPALIAQVQFSNWTDGLQLRHPVFLGLREDKPASEVMRDMPRVPK